MVAVAVAVAVGATVSVSVAEASTAVVEVRLGSGEAVAVFVAVSVGVGGLVAARVAVLLGRGFAVWEGTKAVGVAATVTSAIAVVGSEPKLVSVTASHKPPITVAAASTAKNSPPNISRKARITGDRWWAAAR